MDKTGEFLFCLMIALVVPVYVLNILPVEYIEIKLGVREKDWLDMA